MKPALANRYQRAETYRLISKPSRSSVKLGLVQAIGLVSISL